MFWKRKSPGPTLVPYRVALNQMAAAVLEAAGVDFDASSQLTQALVGTYLFGMIHAYCMASKLSPSEVHALAISVFQDTLHYTDEAAVEGVRACIDATDPKHHETMNAIIHRGIDGYIAYSNKEASKAGENLQDILAHFAKP